MKTSNALKKNFYNNKAVGKNFSEEYIDIRYELENNIFLMENNDLGVIYKIQGIYDEVCTYDDIEEKLSYFFRFFRQILPSLPFGEEKSNVTAQFICSQRSINFPPEKVSPDNKEIYSFNLDTEIGRLLDAEEKNIFKNGLLSRNFYISLRISTNTKNRKASNKNKFFEMKDSIKKKVIDKIDNLIDYKNNNIKIFEHEIKEYLYHFENALVSLEQEISSSNTTKIKRIGRFELISYIQNVLNSGKDSEFIFSDQDYDIHKNIYTENINISDDRIEFTDNNGNITGNTWIYSLPIPKEDYCHGKLKNFIQDLTFNNWDMIWTFSDAWTKLNPSIRSQIGWYERNKAEQKLFDGLKNFQDQIGTETPYGTVSFKILAHNINDYNESSLKTSAISHLNHLLREKDITTHMYVTSLPLCATHNENKTITRCFTSTLEKSLSLLPLYDGPSSDRGYRWWISRSGIPCRFDLFEGDGNNHALVLGITGGGKSCLMSQIYLEFLDRFPNGIIRVIDKKTSSQKLADLFGGRVIKFSEEHLKLHTYSPFALAAWDHDDIIQIFLLILTLIVQKNKNIEITSLHEEILIDAIKLTYNTQAYSNKLAKEKGYDVNKHPIWEDIKQNLSQAAIAKDMNGATEAKDDIVRWTISMESTGMYNFIFSRHQTHVETFENEKFIVYDLDGIADNTLRLLAAQITFMNATRDVQKLPRSTKKLFAYEEFGMFLIGDDDVTQKMNQRNVLDMVKTARKFQAQIFTITNSVSDYAENLAGKSVWENARHKIFLPLGKNMSTNLVKAFPNEFDEAEDDILKSLKLNKPKKYSMSYIKSDTEIFKNKTTILLPLTPRMDTIVTTSGNQSQLYNQLREKGYSPAIAIDYMVDNFPYGIGLEKVFNKKEELNDEQKESEAFMDDPEL